MTFEAIGVRMKPALGALLMTATVLIAAPCAGQEPGPPAKQPPGPTPDQSASQPPGQPPRQAQGQPNGQAPGQSPPLASVRANPLPAIAGGLDATALIGTPVSNLFPGDVPIKSGLQAPKMDENAAADRGMRYFNMMNCVGCHGGNGGGGIGPALSNSSFIYGDKPEQIFLSIYQGRPHGMPAWGAMLPPSLIWDLVAYVKSISREPNKEWGRTISKTSPDKEQVPAEYMKTADPWAHLEDFSHGDKPNRAK